MSGMRLIWLVNFVKNVPYRSWHLYSHILQKFSDLVFIELGNQFLDDADKVECCCSLCCIMGMGARISNAVSSHFCFLSMAVGIYLQLEHVHQSDTS